MPRPSSAMVKKGPTGGSRMHPRQNSLRDVTITTFLGLARGDASCRLSSGMDREWQFLKDHPFGIAKDPYADGFLPSFPSYCKPTIVGQDN